MDEKQSIPKVGGKEAGYLFEFKPEGVFLTVYPSEDTSILFELSDMRQILKDYGVDTYDIEVLAHTVREASGKPQKLAEKFTAPIKEALSVLDALEERAMSNAENSRDDREYGKVRVNISKDRMSATIHFEMKENLKRPTEEMVMTALQENRVVYGIDLEAIKSGVESNEDFVAARGLPPENGEDARIERKFNLEEKGRPAVNKYDQVDYKNLNLFFLVKKGDLLAERIPQTPGTPGRNVLGDEVQPKHGKPKPMPSGKNTEVREENFVYADIDGQIVDTGSKISVDPRLVISSDVGVSTGNIDFTGSVSISGSVQAGFLVRATGDIEIKGMVSGADIEGRNVYISGGIQGMNRGTVKAREDVRATYAENAEIEAEQNIYISDVALHSTLRAGKKLIVEGKRGLITGGMLVAGDEIRANKVGNPANVVTRLVVGINPMLERKYQEICKEYADAKKRLSQLTKALNTLTKIDVNKLPPERVKQLAELTRSQFPLAGLVERDERLLRQMDAEMQVMQKGKVRVADTIYPGVKLKINSVLKNMQAEDHHCTLTAEDDFIRTGPY